MNADAGMLARNDYLFPSDGGSENHEGLAFGKRKSRMSRSIANLIAMRRQGPSSNIAASAETFLLQKIARTPVKRSRFNRDGEGWGPKVYLESFGSYENLLGNRLRGCALRHL